MGKRRLAWFAASLVALSILGTTTAKAQDDDSATTDTPLVTQECSEWCWAATIEMVSGVDQCRVVSAMSGVDCCQPLACGTPVCNHQSGGPFSIDRALQLAGKHGRAFNGPLAEQALRGELAAGHAVLLASTNIRTGHFVVVTGYEKAGSGYRYTVNDPWPGVGQVTVPYQRLRAYAQGNPWLFTWIVTN